MTALAHPLRLAGKLALTLSLIAISAAAINTRDTAGTQDPRTIALKSWHDHLQQIGWPKDMSEQHAPRFLGHLSQTIANEHGGQTITFDGSRPGLLAKVTIVMGADGRPVAKPVVQCADVMER